MQPLAVSELQSKLGLVVRDAELFRQALTHTSFVNESADSGLRDNQRLEFLGDALLDLIVGEWLYLRYPEASEGDLTSLRAFLVRTETLAQFAGEIELGSYLCLGRGEDASGGRERIANLCAAFEALMGAMYLDQGLHIAREWVFGLLARHAQEIDERQSAKDAKSRLQEITQAQLHVTPTYGIIDETGPDHAKVFTAQVLVDGAEWGTGKGNSKQLAEQAAAQAALTAHRRSRSG